jgi:hypothetical protein
MTLVLIVIVASGLFAEFENSNNFVGITADGALKFDEGFS